MVALDGLVISFWLAKRHREAHRAFFNMSAPAVSAWCSARLFFAVSGISPLANHPASLNQIFPSLALSALVYFCLNTWLITFAIASERRTNPFQLWKSKFLWLSLNYFCGASVAALVAVYNRNIDVAFIGVIVPLLLVIYVTFRTTMARVEDADRHLTELNALYLSTIETLAMAIDAKDQVTHGHIRRVQSCAVGLAGHIGLTDLDQIKALEAAALLHDMGKLAVPEYILNKPGKLTAAEFEKMKLHASVGADILSAISFPYPVVPIVRHHHENWDGSGYPSGLKGAEIPIGARILSVVDCFDALTSDRPYRPRLSDAEALAIIVERRGSMYDPLIVDTFLRVYKSIVVDDTAANPTVAVVDAALTERAQFQMPNAPAFAEIVASSDETAAMYEMACRLPSEDGNQDQVTVISEYLRRLVPHSLLVFFSYRPATDDLEASHALGEHSLSVKGMRMDLGQRLSGWVAANRQTIVNSDATLDLGNIARVSQQTLRSCISAPVIADDQLVGVLTLYSPTANAFSENHRRILETVARQTSFTFKNLGRGNSAQRQGSGDESPVGRRTPQRPTETSSIGVIRIEIANFDSIRTNGGKELAEELIQRLLRERLDQLDAIQAVVRYSENELLALLDSHHANRAAEIARTIEAEASSALVVTRRGTALPADIRATVVGVGQQGGQLTDVRSTNSDAHTSSTPQRPLIH